jgi:hypothetical protein
MKSIRVSFLLLAAHMAFLYNIERIDFGQENVINIQTYVYIIITLAIFSIILFPVLLKYNIIYGFVFWVGIYFILKFTVFFEFFVGGIYTYITITEITFLVSAIFLSYNFSKDLYDAEETIKNLIFTRVDSGIKGLREARDDIQKEIYRSRRYQQPLALMLFDYNDADLTTILNMTVMEIQRTAIQYYVEASMFRGISKTLRRTDILIEDSSKGRFLLLSPELNDSAAQVLIDRIKTKGKKEFGVDLKSSVVVFPEDAVTFEDLLNSAIESLD